MHDILWPTSDTRYVCPGNRRPIPNVSSSCDTFDSGYDMPSIPSSSLENVGCQQQGRQPCSRTRLRCWPKNGVLPSRRNTHHRDPDTIVCGYERVIMMGSVPYKRAYSRKQQVIGDFSRVRHSRCAHNNPVTDTLVRCQNNE